MKRQRTKLTEQRQHHPQITTRVMTTERQVMAQINKRQQEIKERLALDVK